MAERQVDVLLLSVGPDLPWLIGYQAMPLERLTMLVLPRDGEPVLVVPRLEAPRVVERPGLFSMRPWTETEDPLDLVAGLVGAAGAIAIDDRTWARFVLDLQARRPDASYTRASTVTGAAAGGEGRGRDRGADPGRRGRRSAWPRRSSRARSR